jgi:hypothetical protein
MAWDFHPNVTFDGAYATEACCGELGASATAGRSKAPVSTTAARHPGSVFLGSSVEDLAADRADQSLDERMRLIIVVAF